MNSHEIVEKVFIPFIITNLNKKKKKKLGARIYRNRTNVFGSIDQLREGDFQRLFRLNRASFYWLLVKISPLIQSCVSSKFFSGLKEIHLTAETKLAATLRYLAGGSYLDTCLAFGFHFSTFFRRDGPIWSTIEAIDRVLTIEFPQEPEQLQEVLEGFKSQCYGAISGCVMAIDGWVCKTRCPNTSETDNQVCFRNRKGCFGLVVLAGCNHRAQFTMVSAKFPGSMITWLSLL